MPHDLHIFANLLLIGPIIGATCALLSVFVVLRWMAPWRRILMRPPGAFGQGHVH
jgi:hypothetical protein